MTRTGGQPLKKPKKKPKKSPQTKEKSELRKLYERYLRSKQFKEVKDIVHQRDGEKCQFCGRTAEECAEAHTTLQVHHREYSALGKGGEEEANTCILVCGCCHRGLHSVKGNIRRFMDKSPILDNWKNR